MDGGTSPPKRPKLNPHGKALRRERIFERVRGGWSYEAIATEQGVTPRRIRQIISEALRRQEVDGGPATGDAAACPARRRASPWGGGRRRRRHRRDRALSQRARSNRPLPARGAFGTTGARAGEPLAAEAEATAPRRPREASRVPSILPQALEKTGFSEAKNLDFASAGFEFPSLRIWIFLPFAFGIVSSRTLAAILR